MLSTKYFNLQLLCAASVLIAATTQTSPLPTYAQGFSSTSTSSTTASEPLNSPDSLSLKQRPTVNLDRVTSYQIDEIYGNTHKIGRQLEKLNRNNKWIRFIALLTAAQTIYIINKEYPNGIAPIIKEQCAEKYQQLLNAIPSITKGSQSTTHEQSKGGVDDAAKNEQTQNKE